MTTSSREANVISDDALDLLEYRLSERVEKRVYERVRLLAIIASAILTFFGVCLGYFGAKQVGDVQKAAKEAKIEIEAMRLSVANSVRDFSTVTLPQTRTRIAHVVAVERLSRFPDVPGKAALSDTSVNSYLHGRFPEDYNAKDLKEYAALFAEYNVTSSAQLDEIYGAAGIQRRVVDCYLQVLKRKPDPFGMFDKGIRMLRGGISDEEILEELTGSPEYQLRFGKPTGN